MKGLLAKKEEKKQNGAMVQRPEYPFGSLQQEVNKLFEDFGHGFTFNRPWFEPMTDFQARTDIKETEKEVIITVEVPGVDMENIEISLRDDALSISGEKHVEKEENEKGYYRMERSYGSFHRIIPLPCAIDRDKADATYKDGVLKVSLPKTTEALKQEQKLTVKAG